MIECSLGLLQFTLSELTVRSHIGQLGFRDGDAVFFCLAFLKKIGLCGSPNFWIVREGERMIWSPEEIRQLRQRLGWSRAELARRLGMSSALVFQLEQGEVAVNSETTDELEHLQDLLKSYNLRTVATPLAESQLSCQSWEQVQDDWLGLDDENLK